MANSPLVSIRIPPETLDQIDQLAERLYPSRRIGKKPNRSQVILDAIEQFLDQFKSDDLMVTNETVDMAHPDESIQCDEPDPLPQTPAPVPAPELESLPVGTEIAERCDMEDLNLSHPFPLNIDEQVSSRFINYEIESQPQPQDLSTRKYIDWWLDYFSYMRKLTKTWFIPR